MPKNTATKKSVDRQLKWYKRRRRANPGGPGILIEGDSWFSTPVVSWEGPTLVGRLKAHRKDGKRQFAIVSVANPGADLVDMITPSNVDLAFATSQLTSKQMYNLALLSCGGNDVLGEKLKTFLIDVPPGTPARRRLEAAGDDMEKAARRVLKCKQFTDFLGSTLGARLREFRKAVLKDLGMNHAPILVHGYDYPIPDGRQLSALGIKLGPWLLSEFKKKKIPKKYHIAVVKLLIDEFNSMVRGIATSQSKFHFLDLRGLLTKTSDWSDEIHPHTSTGMIKIRKEMVAAIHAVHDGTAGPVIGGGRIASEYTCK